MDGPHPAPGIRLPIVDSCSESGSDTASTVTDTESEASSSAGPARDPRNTADVCRPSALRSRLPLLPPDMARTTAAADSVTAEWPRSWVLIHPSHQSEAGIQLLAAALLDLDQELVRAGTRPLATSYPRTVPRCPIDVTWHFRYLMRRVQLHLAALGQGDD